MTTKEKIKVMQHHVGGGKVQRWRIGSEWIDSPIPSWNWSNCEWRIKPKPVELLYEYIYKDTDGNYVLGDFMRKDKELRNTSTSYTNYTKTGRYFNPETKEFGVEHD